MTSCLAAARAMHFASAMLLFGELVFVLFIAGLAPSLPREHARRRLRAVVLWSIAASIASWIVWLGCEAALMSGAPLVQALSSNTLALVFAKTAFGRLWLVRLGLAAALAALLWWSTRDRQDRRRRSRTLAALALTAAFLASLAWAGHAAGGASPERDIQLASDVVHLLAAGAWVGALPALVALIRDDAGLDSVVAATRRFSGLGIASVSALLLTGFVNAWYLVGDIPALVGTDYGRLLLAKLALFAVMLAFAAVNRLALAPRLQRDPAAAARLRRNALFETAAGAGIVAIVGALGIAIPGAHQSPVWPFSRGLDLEQAYPTSYATSPVRYTTAAIARGAALYAQQCSSCHGPLGHGDGTLAASLAVRPTNLAEHASFHRPGGLFWFVAHGVPDTPMPGFAVTLSESDIWTLVQFMRALSDSESTQTMSGSESPSRPIVVPDFPFELAGRTQESLARQRAEGPTLLVFYTLPQSLPRVQRLRAQMRAYADHGVRVVAVPMEPTSARAQASVAERDPSIVAITAADVPATYAMFARTRNGEELSGHSEFLIDAQGYLRRRWLGLPEDSSARTVEQLAQVDAVAREPMRTTPEKTHAH